MLRRSDISQLKRGNNGGHSLELNCLGDVQAIWFYYLTQAEIKSTETREKWRWKQMPFFLYIPRDWDESRFRVFPQLCHFRSPWLNGTVKTYISSCIVIYYVTESLKKQLWTAWFNRSCKHNSFPCDKRTRSTEHFQGNVADMKSCHFSRLL